ncbi:DegT/DnrJ/EryC1/StrS family aminotransferase [Stutzerimonas nitrititolerans]|uniref:DegT/DnrJ/EryC1/StrS family aminotransferase n=1 Tax=Stutzerimonas nitrititolerans TaxID=2482751 RepID=A0AA41WQX6_9GAMM|nr:DegT/DnrJ/EryC1/StrS family aminotransferase [Stutzerimonas nitrititolerans]MCO7546960.1 DegT/DnrJ/EryC1/StrS family aminotransferase [Stutzerimonas nitrititolerans]
MIPFLNLQALNQRFEDEFQEVLRRVLSSGWYIHGEECGAFEAEFAAYCGVQHAVGVGNGLDALVLILRALLETGRLQPDDEVLVPGNTFIASALAVSACGLRVRLVEPELSRFNLDPQAVEAAIGERTRVILAVHLYGRMADMPALADIARRHGLLLLEDAAQAQGARLGARRAGAWGVAAGFSLFPGKPLGALGDGGVVTTDDSELALTIRSLQNYGAMIKYQHDRKGGNSRLDELQAAFLRIKLRCLDADNQARHAIALRYAQGLDQRVLCLPEIPAEVEIHSWHLYVIRSANRDALQQHLLKSGVQTLIHYPTPIHRQAAYRELGNLNLPITEMLSEQVLSLPIYPGLSAQQVDQVIEVCNSFAVNEPEFSV